MGEMIDSGRRRAAILLGVAYAALVLAVSGNEVTTLTAEDGPEGGVGEATFGNNLEVTVNQELHVRSRSTDTKDVERLLDSHMDSQGHLKDDFDVELGGGTLGEGHPPSQDGMPGSMPGSMQKLSPTAKSEQKQMKQQAKVMQREEKAERKAERKAETAKRKAIDKARDKLDKIRTKYGMNSDRARKKQAKIEDAADEKSLKACKQGREASKEGGKSKEENGKKDRAF